MTAEAALVPELEGKTNKRVALCAKERRDGGGIDSSGHGNGDYLGTTLGH
jgi:hypothetical protein